MTTLLLEFALMLAALTPVLGMPLHSSDGSTSVRYLSHTDGTLTTRDAEVATMFSALNAERAASSLRPLHLDRKLCGIARSFAMQMAQRNFFSHNTPEGESPFTRLDHAHYRYGYAGENIALEPNAAAATQALWRSLEHRENILEPHYAHVGIAVVAANAGEIFVEDFSD